MSAKQVIKEMNQINVSGSFLVLLRLTLGFAFFTTWISNFIKGVFTPVGYRGIVNGYISANIETPFNIFAKSVLLPNAEVFVLVQIIIELVISISLIFGIFTRLGSIIGIFVSINLLFLTLGVPGEWLWTYIMMIVGFFLTGIYSAGRWYGLDFWFQKYLPEKLTLILI